VQRLSFVSKVPKDGVVENDALAKKKQKISDRSSDNVRDPTCSDGESSLFYSSFF